MYENFRDIKSVERIISKFPNRDAFYYFLEKQEKQLIELFRRDKAEVIETEEGNYCSHCGYGFGVDSKTGDNETNYHYCSGCLDTLLCCDNSLCDSDRERLQYEINNKLEEFFRNSHK